jgi:CheY-like chemotaxis protein
MSPTSILLVDDDKDTCSSLSDILSDLGFGVDMAYDGASALELSGRNGYLLALLDYKMPGIDGLELCYRLKRLQPDIEVALVTGFVSADTADMAFEAGVQRVFPKPVDFAKLIPFVEEVVGGSPGGAGETG